VIWVAAFLEELVYRGVVFRLLEAAWGLPAALGVQAVLFGLAHLGNGGTGWTTMLSTTLLGALWALIFARTRNLWAATAHHAGWNFAIVLAGPPLSGIEDWRAASPIDAVAVGPDWLTGGAFGPENSPITLVLLLVAVAALWPRTDRAPGTPGSQQEPNDERVEDRRSAHRAGEGP
ncbi:MAG: CPBP family intramembrane glutamic endopeptidase, partial [Myxococcota bacterium]